MENNLHIELTSLQEELLKLKTAVEYVESAKVTIEAANSIIESTKVLQEKYNNFSKAIETLIKDVKEVDFPTRLDNIFSVLSGLNKTLGQLFSLLEESNDKVLREIKGRTGNILKDIEKNNIGLLALLNKHSLTLMDINNSIENVNKNLIEAAEKQNKEIKIIKAVVFISVILLLATLIKLFL